MRRANWLEIVALNAYWFGIAFLWNGLSGLVLPIVILHYVPEDQKNTYLGLLTFAGLVIAIIVQPVAGLVSDRWASRWGRRRPLIALGTAFDFVFLALIAFATGLPGLVVGLLALQVSSNVAHGPALALLPDRVPPERHGVASGIKNLFDMGGLVVASLLVGRLVPPEVRQPVQAVGVIALVLVVVTLITLLGVREAPSTRANQPRGVPHAALGPRLARALEHRAYWWLIASRLAFLAGITGVRNFAIYFVRDVLAAADPARLTGDLMAAMVVTLTLVALLSGWLVDRAGPHRLLLIACGVAAAGCLLLATARTEQALLIFGSLVGAGVGLFLTANWALANALAPQHEAGLFLGLTNLATAGAGALAALEGPVIDLLNNAWPGAYWGYVMLFSLGAVGALLSAALLRGARQPGGVPRASAPAPPA